MTIHFVSNSPHVSEWVAKRVGLECADDFGPHASIGVARDKPIAGVVYSWLRKEPHGNDVRVSIAAVTGSHWAQPVVLRRLFEYPFEQLDCVRLTAIIREGNAASERMVRHMGFRKEGVMRRAWDGKSNALVYGMLKSECRYLHG